MPRSHRRSLALVLVLATGLALAAPAAQAQESAGLFDALSARFANWIVAVWPHAASAKQLRPAGPAAPVRSIGGTHGVVSGGHRIIGIRPDDCVGTAPDPNGCPPPH